MRLRLGEEEEEEKEKVRRMWGKGGEENGPRVSHIVGLNLQTQRIPDWD